MNEFHETAGLHMVQSQFSDGLADMGIIRSDKHFDCIVAGTVKNQFRTGNIGQQSAEDDECQRGSRKTQQCGEERGKDTQGLSSLLLIHADEQQRRRRGDGNQRTAHDAGIAHGYEQLGGVDAYFLGPELDNVHKECNNRGVVHKCTQHSYGQHQAQQSRSLALRPSKHMFRNPLKHTRVG